MKEKLKKILNKRELSLVKKLNTPKKVQDFLDQLPFNFEEREETYMSPREMLKANKAHCFEGVLFASLCLTYHGYQNFILDLKVGERTGDVDHALCVFKVGKFWGAISKTNHSVLRWRDPIYKNIREIAFSYFHEYFLNDGKKTLVSYSAAFDVWKHFGTDWITSRENLHPIALSLDEAKHLPFVPKENKKFVRKAGKTEIEGAAVTEWKK